LTQTLQEPLSDLDPPFRLMVENSHDIFTIRDADGRVRYANPSFYRILGYQADGILGETCFDMLHPEDRDVVLEAFQGFIKTPGARGTIRYRARHSNGSWLTFEVVAYNMLDHPVIRGLVINGRDISDRTQEDTGKDQLISELQHTLAHLNTLSGILTICCSCKKINKEDGHWQQIEAYIRDRAQVEFSHGLCPECTHIWFPDVPINNDN
jgi:PAS domain S-box-containing protein